VLKNVPLFSGIDEDEIKTLFPCIGVHIKYFRRNEAIISAGDDIKHIGIILDGKVQVLKDDINGNRNILANLGKTELFAEVFSYAGIKKSPVTVSTDTGAVIMFIDFRKIIKSCTSSCIFHSRLIENMLGIIAKKNLSLNEKIECIGQRTIRQKIEAFLTLQMEKAGSSSFEIPFSRAQMAEYLCVDRSAMSAVLSKMRDEGVIRFNRNRFEIL